MTSRIIDFSEILCYNVREKLSPNTLLDG